MTGLHDPRAVPIDLLNPFRGFLVCDGRMNCIGRGAVSVIGA